MIALALWAGTAGAHVGDIIAGLHVLVPGPGAPVSIEATFGVLVGQSDGTIGWTCHEAVTTPTSIFLPQYDVSRSGEWLAVLRVPEEGRDGQTLFHSPAGCAWNHVEGLDGIVVNYATFDPDEPTLAFAATATSGEGSVHRSADGGRTWTVDLQPIAERTVQSVQVVDHEVYAAGANLPGTEAFVWHRNVKGAWTVTALPDLGDREGAQVRVLAVSDDAVYIHVDPPGNDLLFVADRQLSNFDLVIDGQGEILDAAVGPDGVWLPMDFGDRALLLAADGTFTEQTPPPSVGAAVDAEGRILLASLAYLDGPLLNARLPDGTFEVLLYPDDVLAPLDCPAGTETADICGPLWEGLQPRLRGFDAPPPSVVPTAGDTGRAPAPSDAASCSCVTPGSSGAWCGVAGLLMLGVRRRRRARTVRVPPLSHGWASPGAAPFRKLCTASWKGFGCSR